MRSDTEEVTKYFPTGQFEKQHPVCHQRITAISPFIYIHFRIPVSSCLSSMPTPSISNIIVCFFCSHYMRITRQEL